MTGRVVFDAEYTRPGSDDTRHAKGDRSPGDDPAVSAYKNDARVQIGLYEAFVSSPDGPKYVFAGDSRDDWVAAPADASTTLRAADARRDEATIRGILNQNPHFGSFDEAIHSLIGDPA